MNIFSLAICVFLLTFTALSLSSTTPTHPHFFVSAAKCTYPSQRTQCGSLTCNVTSRSCMPCEHTAQCWDEALECRPTDLAGPDHGAKECELISLSKLFSKRPAGLIASMISSIAICAIAVIGGVGGGGMLVPAFSRLMGLPLIDAVGLSQATIVGQSTLNVFLMLPKFHPQYQPPNPTRPLINYPLLVFWLPISLVGTSIGNIMGRVVFDSLRILLLFVLLGYTLKKLLDRMRKQRREDEMNKTEAQAATVAQTSQRPVRLRGVLAAGSAGSGGDENDDENINNDGDNNSSLAGSRRSASVQDDHHHQNQNQSSNLLNISTDDDEDDEDVGDSNGLLNVQDRRRGGSTHRHHHHHHHNHHHHHRSASGKTDHQASTPNNRNRTAAASSDALYGELGGEAASSTGNSPVLTPHTAHGATRSAHEPSAVPAASTTRGTNLNSLIGENFGEESRNNNNNNESNHNNNNNNNNIENTNDDDIIILEVGNSNQSGHQQQYQGGASGGGGGGARHQFDYLSDPTSGDGDNNRLATAGGAASDNNDDGDIVEPAFPQYPFLHYLICLLTFVPLLGANIGKNRWVDCGSSEFWLITLGIIAYNVSISAWFRRYLAVLYNKVRDGDIEPEHVPFRWNDWTTIYYPIISVTAGAAASLLGIGGGLILSFLFLEAGLVPEEASATSGFATFAVALESLLQFVIQDQVRGDYFIAFFLCGCVACAIGQFVLMPQIRARGWRFLIVGSLVFIMAGSMIALTWVGVEDTLNLLRHGGSIGFGDLCPTEDAELSSRNHVVHHGGGS